MTTQSPTPPPDLDWREKPALAWSVWLAQLSFRDQILYGLLFVFLGIGIGYLLFAADNGYTVNLYTDIISVAFTVFVLDALNRRRDARREERELKALLLRQARSDVNDVAKQAINEIRERGWLTGTEGLLKGADLSGADLQGANLHGANLEETDLSRANLQEANLSSANLEGANLRTANLSSTTLFQANFRNANLDLAILVNANLYAANLCGANLSNATLSNTELGQAIFDLSTILPDGYPWSPSPAVSDRIERLGAVFRFPFPGND